MQETYENDILSSFTVPAEAFHNILLLRDHPRNRALHAQ